MKIIPKEQVKEEPALFTKEQVLSAKRYQSRRDILQSILQDDLSYSLLEVDEMIVKFMKGKVK